jgi:hypothetical protein
MPFVFGIVALSGVDLIQGASRAFILSDFETGAAGWSGKLQQSFARHGRVDRDPSRAMPPRLLYPGDKSFSLFVFFTAAQLFTVVRGELFRALLANG